MTLILLALVFILFAWVARLHVTNARAVKAARAEGYRWGRAEQQSDGIQAGFKAGWHGQSRWAD